MIDLTSFRTVGIAAAIVLLIGSLWWFQNRGAGEKELSVSAPIAQAEKRSAAFSTDGQLSPPESENLLAQTSPAATANEQAPPSKLAEQKKVADEMSVTADAARGSAAMLGAVTPSSLPPTHVAAAPVQVEAATGNTATEEDATKLSSTQNIGEVNVRTRRYERPLIEPKQPGSRTVLTDKEIEKMPTRNPLDAASTAPGVYQGRSGGDLSIGGGRGENTLYVVDGAIEDGKSLYKKGSYAAALKVFRKQMNTGSGAEQQEATLYAARCYRALGKNAAAKKLLRSLAESTGSRARAARRELRAMGEESNSDKDSDRSSNDD